MPDAISYMRFSSAPQSKGSTLDRQERSIYRWLSDNPDVDRSTLSASDEGRSGYKGDHLNHGLGGILDAIDAGKIKAGDYILVEALDRIGRLEPLEMVSLIQRIVEKDVIVVTLEDGNEYTRDILNSGAGALFVLVGKIQQAHEYSKNLSRRISASYEKKRRKAREGQSIRIHTSFWLNSEGKLIPHRAEIVRNCIDLYLKGYGNRRIILELMETYSELQTVYPTTLKRWFKNRSLIGEWENKGDPISGVFEPLVDTTTFYRLQRELERRSIKTSPEETYDLSGLVVCSKCNSRYHFRRKKHSDYTIVYANCSTYLKRGKAFCDNNKTWPYEVLKVIFEETYWEALSGISSNLIDNEDQLKLDGLEAQLSEVNENINTLLDLLVSMPNQQNIIDKISFQNEQKEGLINSISSLKIDLSEVDSTNNDIDLERFNDQYEQLDSDFIFRRDLLKKAGYKILGYQNSMRVMAGPAGEITYTLFKRSTKHKCYFVESHIPEHKLLELSSDEEILEPESLVKFAINRTGVISEGYVDKWEELFNYESED